MLGAFGVIDRTVPVLLNLFFPMEQVFDTEEVYFDKVQRAASGAPRRADDRRQALERSRKLFTTLGFKPPYLKPESTSSSRRRR